MKQALHIFRKDVRRLWPQMLAVMLAIAYFAALDMRWSALGGGTAATVSEFLVAAAVWLLIGRTVHQESLLDENQFWLTRPYEPASFLAAKIMMALCAVSLPLFVADCVSLSVQSLPVVSNLGGLALRQLVVGAWLILPPFAIASVTRRIKADVTLWLVGLVIGFSYVRAIGIDPYELRGANGEIAMVAGALMMLTALVWQYSHRGATVGRALVAAAVLLPGVPFLEPIAWAIDQLGSGGNPAVSGISVSENTLPSMQPPVFGMEEDGNRCAHILADVRGLQEGWQVAMVSEKDTFEPREARVGVLAGIPRAPGLTRRI